MFFQLNLRAHMEWPALVIETGHGRNPTSGICGDGVATRNVSFGAASSALIDFVSAHRQIALLIEAPLSRAYDDALEPVRRWPTERYGPHQPVAAPVLTAAMRLFELLVDCFGSASDVKIAIGEAYFPGPKPRGRHAQEARLIFEQWRSVMPLELARNAAVIKLPPLGFVPDVWRFSMS